MSTTTQHTTPDHLPEREKPGYLNAALMISPLCSVGLLVMAMRELGIGGNSIGGWAKIGLIAITAFVVSYAIYRMAIEKSATLATKGYKSALATGGVTTFLVGFTFFIATSAGLIIGSVEERRLQSHNAEVVAYIDARAAQAGQATRLVPVTEAIFDDLSAKAACEDTSSCVSGRGSGGYGLTARMLETLAARAGTIVEKASSGLSKRETLLAELDQITTRMDEVLADEASAIWDRRRELRKLDAELGGVLNALDEAVPLALMVAYAQELRAGITMPDEQVENTINTILTGYAISLEAVLGGLTDDDITRPTFPDKTGALQTFAYAASFAPIILIAFLVDMVFPLTLWIYTLKGLDWAAYQNNPARKRTTRNRTDFDALTEFQVMDMPRRHDGRTEPRPVFHTRRN